jgi:hypothetical protein
MRSMAVRDFVAICASASRCAQTTNSPARDIYPRGFFGCVACSNYKCPTRHQHCLEGCANSNESNRLGCEML